MEDHKPRLAAKGATPEQRRQAAAMLGSARTPAKLAATEKARAARTADQMGGRIPVPLLDIPCRCEAGEALDGHHWSCPRGQAIKRRRAAGRDVMTGKAA